MRANTIECLQNDFSSRAAITGAARILNRTLCLAAKGFTALVPALGIVVGIAWAISVPGLEQLLQAFLWASGFIFLALAIDPQKPTVFLQLASGIALLILAQLSSHVAGEFAIVAAVLVAAWVAASILKR